MKDIIKVKIYLYNGTSSEVKIPAPKVFKTIHKGPGIKMDINRWAYNKVVGGADFIAAINGNLYMFTDSTQNTLIKVTKVIITKETKLTEIKC